MNHFNLIIKVVVFILISAIARIDAYANPTMDFNSTTQTAIEQDPKLFSSNNNDFISQPHNSTLCGVIILEILVSILVFLKLGSDYLKSNKPYLPNARVSLPF